MIKKLLLILTLISTYSYSQNIRTDQIRGIEDSVIIWSGTDVTQDTVRAIVSDTADGLRAEWENDIGAIQLDNLEDVSATAAPDSSMLLFDQNTGFWNAVDLIPDLRTEWQGDIGDSLDKLDAAYVTDFIGAVDTSVSWTAVLQSTIDFAKANGKKAVFNRLGVALLTKAGDSPYEGGTKDYCIDLGDGDSNVVLIIPPGVVLKMKDGQQTDATGAVDIIIGRNLTNVYIGGGGEILGNTAGQTGWTGGYAQVSTNGSIINIKSTSVSGFVGNYNITIDNLILYDHWSNPLDIGVGEKILLRDLSSWSCGEGYQLQWIKNVHIDNLTYADSSEVGVGDALELSHCDIFTITNCRLDYSLPMANFDIFASKNGVVSNSIANGIQTSTSAALRTVDNVLVTSCKFGTGDLSQGIPFQNAGGTIIYDNILVDSSQYAFQIADMINGNNGLTIIRNSTFKNIGSSAGLISGDLEVIIENCYVENTVFDAYDIIKDGDSDTPTVHISGGAIKNIGRYGIFADNQGSSTWYPLGSISGVVFSDINNNDFIFGAVQKMVDGGGIIVPVVQKVSGSNVSGSSILHPNSGSPHISSLDGLDRQILTIFHPYAAGSGGIQIRDKVAFGSGNIKLTKDETFWLHSGESITLQFNGDSLQWYELYRSTKSTRNNTEIIDGWALDNVAANLTGEPLIRQSGVMGSRFYINQDCWVRRVGVASNGARTAGTLTVNVYVDGSINNVYKATLDGTNTTFDQDLIVRNDTYIRTAGEYLEIRVTTDASWAPVTADIIAWIELEY